MAAEEIDWSKCDDVESVPGRVSGALRHSNDAQAAVRARPAYINWAIRLGRLLSTPIRPPLRNRKFVDFLLERNGFEHSVPRQICDGFAGSSELGPICGAPVIRAVPARYTDRLAGLRSGEPPLTARIRRRHTAAALSAAQRIAEPKVRIRLPPAESHTNSIIG
jgi:hypothetical protein